MKRPSFKSALVLQVARAAAAGADAEGCAASPAAALADAPPTSNTGGNKPRLSVDERLVLEGGKVKVLCAERQQSGPSGVIVDYLRATVKKDQVVKLPDVRSTDDESLVHVLAFRVACVLGFELGEARKGRDYYDHTWTIINAFGKEVASVSGGGDTQRETFCVTLKGEACTFAGGGWERRLHAFLAPMDPKITRIDLARDFLDGGLSIQEVVDHYLSGSFDYRNRRPNYQQHGCWLEGQVGMSAKHSARAGGEGFPKLYGHARTFQVGQRDSGKLLRAYEKGHQFKMLEDSWLRLEVELRNKDRVIPFDALIRPADFFAGAYDFCQMVLDEKPVPEKIVTGKKVGEASVAAMMRWVERTVAPTLVHIAAALPDFTWLENIVANESMRRAPRAIAGLSHSAVVEGLTKYLTKFQDAPEPAGLAFP